MDTKNQLTCFLLSVIIGFLGGLLYEMFAFIRFTLGCERGKRKGIGVTLDIVFSGTFAIWACYASFLFHFPSFRVYMSIGWLLGGIIYAKTLRRMVAFFENMCYNVLVKVLKKAKSKDKSLQRREDLRI